MIARKHAPLIVFDVMRHWNVSHVARILHQGCRGNGLQIDERVFMILLKCRDEILRRNKWNARLAVHRNPRGPVLLGNTVQGQLGSHDAPPSCFHVVGNQVLEQPSIPINVLHVIERTMRNHMVRKIQIVQLVEPTSPQIFLGQFPRHQKTKRDAGMIHNKVVYKGVQVVAFLGPEGNTCKMFVRRIGEHFLYKTTFLDLLTVIGSSQADIQEDSSICDWGLYPLKKTCNQTLMKKKRIWTFLDFKNVQKWFYKEKFWECVFFKSPLTKVR